MSEIMKDIRNAKRRISLRYSKMSHEEIKAQAELCYQKIANSHGKPIAIVNPSTDEERLVFPRDI